MGEEGGRVEEDRRSGEEEEVIRGSSPLPLSPLLSVEVGVGLGEGVVVVDGK